MTTSRTFSLSHAELHDMVARERIMKKPKFVPVEKKPKTKFEFGLFLPVEKRRDELMQELAK